MPFIRAAAVAAVAPDALATVLAGLAGAVAVWHGPDAPGTDIVGAVDLTIPAGFVPFDALPQGIESYIAHPVTGAGQAGATTGAGTIALHRTTDRWCCFLYRSAATSESNEAVLQLGAYNSAHSWCVIRTDGSGNVGLYSPQWDASVTLFTRAAAAGKWVMLWLFWDQSALKTIAYWSIDGGAEGTAELADTSEGSALTQLWESGNGSNINTLEPMAIAGAGVGAAELTADMRSAGYSAVGWEVTLV